MNSTDVVNIVVGLGGVIVAYFLVPWTKEQRDLRKAKRAMTVWLFGKKGVKGISEDIQSAPEQMTAMKTDICSIRRDVNKLLSAVGDLVDIARKTNQTVKAVDSKITPNGGDTNNPGDLQMRMAKERGVWIEGK